MVWATTHQADTAGVVLIDATSAAAEREIDKQVRQHYPAEAELQGHPEQVDMSADAARLDALPSLGTVPLVVLTHTLNQPDPYHPNVDWDAVERAWVDGQRHWVTYSDVSEMVSVPNAGHSIHADQLDIVVAAMLRMIQSPT